MRKFLYGVLAIWGIILFIITLLIVTPLYFLIFLIGGKHAGNKAHILSRIWAAILIYGMFIRLKVENRYFLKKDEAYIFVSNHRSMLDIPACALATDHFFKFLAKAELGKIPLLGYIITRLYLTVDRSSMRSRAKSMIAMKEELNQGISLWIYPEGTRNKTSAPVKDFSDGAFHLAIAAQKPIAAVAIVDTGDILPSGELFQLKPKKIKAVWLPPFQTAGLKAEDAHRLKTEVHQKLYGQIEKLR